ncbi:efflux RND transporter periplasmic adaptor subunit [Microvirga massiliensis]|uniref:efflux RND transporter periplasmic adaptor subunit n=1 Tax=Microvirga massiliensis TaxID=1033741 RepID=UPI001FCDB83D|nr:efflux RND transporter periplasmic adaptor subunit [Microvirga massiliensis]
MAVAVLGGWWVLEHAYAGRPAPRQASAPPAAPVQVASVARANVPLYAVGLGSVQAYNTVTVRSRVDGEVQKIAFQEGQSVKEGDLLVQIDPRPFQAALDQASAKKAQDEAQLANAKLDLERYKELATRSFASKQQLDTQQAMVNQLNAQIQGDQAQIDNARTQLGYTTIRSPIDGRTGLRSVDQGNIVRATDPGGIVTIAQIQPISALFTLPEQDLPALRKAAAAGPATVWALGQDGKTVLEQGSLALINNEVDQATGTIKLKATFDNRDNALWPGQSVSVRVLLETMDALTMPADAVQRTQDGLSVYVVRPDDTVELRHIAIGPITQGVAVLEQGLGEGERVVTAGQYRLQPDTRVQVVTDGAPMTAAIGDAKPRNTVRD